MVKFQSKIWKIFFILTFALFAACLGQQASAAGTVIVSNVLSNSVTLYDETTLQPINEVKVGYNPHEVVVSKDGRTALVSNFGDLVKIIPGHSISVIDVANSKLLQTIQLPAKSRPHGIAIISDSRALVTAQGIQSLLVVDFVTGSIVKTIPLPGSGAHMVAADAEKRFAYVANTDSGSVCKIDLRNDSVVGEVKIGKEAEGLALTNEENLLLVTNRKDNFVGVIRTKDLILLKKIQTARGPVRVAMFNNGKSALVTNSVSGNAQVIDMASLAITKSFNTTRSHSPLPVPINIFVRDDQRTAFITNSFACNITLIDLLAGVELKSFKGGYMPDGIAVSQITAVKYEKKPTETVFNVGPTLINANIEDVWRIVKNVEDYNRISHGAITTHVDGPILAGKNITLELYKDKFVGKFIPKSTELVTVVDDERKVLVWIKKLPDGKYTERYQMLEKISENQTRSSIVLKIPGLIGKVTKVSLAGIINSSLQELNEGIKAEAETNVAL